MSLGFDPQCIHCFYGEIGRHERFKIFCICVLVQVRLEVKRKKMIIPRSLIRIVDNSGAKVCRCIRVLSQSPKTKIGDLAVVSLVKVKPRKVHKGKKKEQLKKGDIRLALIIHTRRVFSRKDGTILKIFKNYGLLVSPKGKSLGSRYNTPLPRELRTEKWLKLVSNAPSLF
jgi:large subunit ribosomal protein L14